MFITFEGIEGCGKTTQVKRFAKRLRKHGIPLVMTLEPGGTRIGKNIRRILLDSRNKDLSALTELILYAADRAQHVEEVIKPALDQGKWDAAPRRIGAKGDHLQFVITDNTASVRCIGFAMARLEKKLLENEFFSVAYQPQINTYNGTRSVELVLRDIRFE